MKTIVLLVVAVVFLLLLASLVDKRQQLVLQQLEEGFSQKDPDYKAVVAEVQSISQKPPFSKPSEISDVKEPNLDLPLHQCSLKASYNSAFSGNYVSDIMVQFLLSRGCRFLDFELYDDPTGGKDDVSVGYSLDPLATKSNASNKNPVSFKKMLQATLKQAFQGHTENGYTTPNTNDPLFLHIRMKTPKDNVSALYQKIQDDIESVMLKNPFYRSYAYGQEVTKDTTLRELVRKVVFVFENNIYTNLQPTTPYCNLISDSSALLKQTYRTINPTYTFPTPSYTSSAPLPVSTNPPHALTTNTVGFDQVEPHLRMLEPDKNIWNQSNPDVYWTIKYYSVQITVFQYYVFDNYLVESETMYTTYNGGILPLAYCLNYIDRYMVPPDSIKNIVGPKLG